MRIKKRKEKKGTNASKQIQTPDMALESLDPEVIELAKKLAQSGLVSAPANEEAHVPHVSTTNNTTTVDSMTIADSVAHEDVVDNTNIESSDLSSDKQTVQTDVAIQDDTAHITYTNESQEETDSSIDDDSTQAIDTNFALEQTKPMDTAEVSSRNNAVVSSADTPVQYVAPEPNRKPSISQVAAQVNASTNQAQQAVVEDDDEDDGIVKCPSCKKKIAKTNTFCPHCGCDIALYGEQTPKNKKRGKKELKRIQKEAERKAAQKVALVTEDLTGITSAFEDGLFESEEGCFSYTLEFPDINYENEREDVQKDIFNRFCQLHAYFPPKTIYQFNLVNIRHERNDLEDLLPVQGKDAKLAALYNEKILIPRLREGRTDIERRNFFTVGVEAPSDDEARRKLATLVDGSKRLFKRIGSGGIETKTLTGLERMHVMHDLIRGDEPFIFDYSMIAKTRKTHARDYLAPTWAAYPPDDLLMKREIVMSGQWIKVFHIRDFGASLRDRAIRAIRELSIPMNISLTFVPQVMDQTIKDIRQNINVAQAAIFDYQSRVAKANGDITRLPPYLEAQEEEGIELLDFILDKDQSIGYFQGFITIYAESREKLDEYSQQLLDEANLWFNIVEFPERQESGFVSALPLARPRIDLFRSLTTAEGANLMPFNARHRADDPKRSYLLGQSSVTSMPIYVDPDETTSPHMWTFGKTGSGKGMLVNSFVTYHMLRHPRDVYDEALQQYVPDKKTPQLISFDFHNEYFDQCNDVEGYNFAFGPNSTTCCNPLDIANESGELTLEAVRSNTDFFLALMEDVMERRLSRIELSLLDRSLNEIYLPHIGKQTRPILEDLYVSLGNQDDELAHELANSLEMYVKGSMNSLSGSTNFMDSPYWTNYCLSTLGTTMQTFVILTLLQHVKQLVHRNNREGRSTIVILEECQILFDNEAAVRFLDSLFSEERKYGLRMICITQLPERVLSHKKVKNLFNNSSIFVFLQQLPQNADLISEMFRLSKSQAECMSENSDVGSGLVIVDGLKIPMKNPIPRENNPFFDRWNTDPLSHLNDEQLSTKAGKAS